MGRVVDEDVVGPDLRILVAHGSGRVLRRGMLHHEAPVGRPEDPRQISGVIPDGIGAVEERDELEDPGQPEAPRRSLSSLSAFRVCTMARSSSVSARW